jgi:hypothetical protein
VSKQTDMAGAAGPGSPMVMPPEPAAALYLNREIVQQIARVEAVTFYMKMHLVNEDELLLKATKDDEAAIEALLLVPPTYHVRQQYRLLVGRVRELGKLLRYEESL